MIDIPIVIGSYAKLIKASFVEGELPLYRWSCVLYKAGEPYGDLSSFIERVDFILHKSFQDVHLCFCMIYLLIACSELY